MSEAVKRIALPSGGWWELRLRPLWRHVRQWMAADGAPGLVEQALASLTAAWSFPEEVSADAVRLRHPGDMAAALEVMLQEVIPAMGGASPEQMAQELFAGLLQGQVPASFAEAHLLALTGWTWHDLQETPADVVQKLAIYLAVRHAMDNRGSLEMSGRSSGMPAWPSF